MARSKPKTKAGHLNLRQAAFVTEYLKDFNGKQAAIRAGYTQRSAEVTASKLLRNSKVSEAISRKMEKAAEKCEVDMIYVLQQAIKLHERCMAEGDGFVPTTAAKALEIIGKHVKIKAFVDQQIQHTHGVHDDTIKTLREIFAGAKRKKVRDG